MLVADMSFPLENKDFMHEISLSQIFLHQTMTLFELQAWLGHQSPATTQHYVSTSPTKLTQAYKDAGYFSRNVCAIEVLV